jgi:pimeloyl-ACP methyl ester carboxylesterase
MLQATLNLAYDGSFREGFDTDTLKTRLIELLRLNQAQRRRVFSGRPVVLRHGLSEDDAVRYCAKLNAIGMAVGLRMEDGRGGLIPFEFRGTGSSSPHPDRQHRADHRHAGDLFGGTQRTLCS